MKFCSAAFSSLNRVIAHRVIAEQPRGLTDSAVWLRWRNRGCSCSYHLGDRAAALDCPAIRRSCFAGAAA